ncbi:hypothetical protein KGP21_05500 [Serratia sp. JSRIV004]|nr:hypothetical protein KGP21_05500 [Serratia sp. JSRIV004]
MNEEVRNNRYFATVKAFRTAINKFFDHTWVAIAGTLARRINDNFPILENAPSS